MGHRREEMVLPLQITQDKTSPWDSRILKSLRDLSNFKKNLVSDTDVDWYAGKCQ